MRDGAMDRAINRAKTCRVRVRRLNDRMYRTLSRATGEYYTLCSTPGGWNCGCEGYGRTGCCKHLGALARRFAREGRGEIVVAPLAVTVEFVDDPTPEAVDTGIEVEWGFRSDSYSNPTSRKSDVERFRTGRTIGAADVRNGYKMRAAFGRDNAYCTGYRLGYGQAIEDMSPTDDPDSGTEAAIERNNDAWASMQDPRGF